MVKWGPILCRSLQPRGPYAMPILLLWGLFSSKINYDQSGIYQIQFQFDERTIKNGLPGQGLNLVSKKAFHTMVLPTFPTLGFKNKWNQNILKFSFSLQVFWVKMSSAPGLIEIEDAYHRIESFIHKTPVMTSSALNKISNENSGQFFNLTMIYLVISILQL